MTIKPKLFSQKILAAEDVLKFLNLELLPIVRRWGLKIGGMLSEPTEFSLPTWDGQTWHSVKSGTVVDAPDQDWPFFADDFARINVARPSITAARAYSVNIDGAPPIGSPITFVNLSSYAHTFGTTTVAPGQACEATYQGGASWVYRLSLFVPDPDSWG